MQTIGPDMRSLRTHTFDLTRNTRIDSILKGLSKIFTVEQADHELNHRCYYDTFDWRLHRANQLFFSSGTTLHLESLSGKQVAVAHGRRRSKYFWWDIEAGKLVDQLKQSVEMRALCPIVEVATDITRFRIMNKDRKTIARLAVRSDQLKEASSELPEQLIIHEIRGYEQEYDAILEQCLRKGCTGEKKKKQVARLLKSSGRTPRDYGAKFRVELNQGMSVGSAVSKICLHLVEDMQKNLPGVIADIDSEFLHDFRIAVRRTRSLLSLMKKIMPREQCKYFQGEFKWLGSVTGPLRDIDVYLLEKQDYLGLLPPSLQTGMTIFFDQLEARRAGELKSLQSHLESERFGKLLSDWHTFLSDPDSELFKDSGEQNSRTYADGVIVKRFRSFLRDGNRISDDSADEELHQLRISGKKFRYLLEFFKSFYNEEQMSLFLKYMKKLQDNLGAFNDLSVQQDMLGGELEGLRTRNLQTIRFAAALGGLIAVLADKHQTVRSEFESTYADFTRPQVQELLLAMVEGSQEAT